MPTSLEAAFGRGDNGGHLLQPGSRRDEPFGEDRSVGFRRFRQNGPIRGFEFGYGCTVLGCNNATSDADRQTPRVCQRTHGDAPQDVPVDRLLRHNTFRVVTLRQSVF